MLVLFTAFHMSLTAVQPICYLYLYLSLICYSLVKLAIVNLCGKFNMVIFTHSRGSLQRVPKFKEGNVSVTILTLANSDTGFKNYSLYHCPGTESNDVFHGGVAILIKNTLAHKNIELSTSLQAVAVRATCFKTVTFCSLYLPLSLKWNKTDIEDLLNQLPPPVVLMGDFNAHSRDWGCPKDDSIRANSLVTYYFNVIYLC